MVATTYRLVCLMKAKVHSSVLISGFMLLSSSKSVTSPEKIKYRYIKKNILYPSTSISAVTKYNAWEGQTNENVQLYCILVPYWFVDPKTLDYNKKEKMLISLSLNFFHLFLQIK